LCRSQDADASEDTCLFRQICSFWALIDTFGSSSTRALFSVNKINLQKNA
jgi:hypothetical protein